MRVSYKACGATVPGGQAAGAAPQQQENSHGRATAAGAAADAQRDLVNGLLFDRTAEDRVIQCPTVVDDATYEIVVIEVARSISASA